jgi:hypothetical protein
MPQILTPNSVGLAEYNRCHNPGGPGGGQFCGRTFPDAARPNPYYVPEGVLTAGEIDAARGRIAPATPEAFKAGITSLKGRARKTMVSDYSVEELGQMKLFLLKGGKAGYAIKNGDELVNLFNAGGKATHLAGQWLVLHAIEQGARRLDCFDSGLPEFYAKFGFKEVRREKNWTPGEPDVVFMEWQGGDIKTARSRYNRNRRIDAR